MKKNNYVKAQEVLFHPGCNKQWGAIIEKHAAILEKHVQIAQNKLRMNASFHQKLRWI